MKINKVKLAKGILKVYKILLLTALALFLLALLIRVILSLYSGSPYVLIVVLAVCLFIWSKWVVDNE